MERKGEDMSRQKKQDEDCIRTRFNVPKQDQPVVDWLNAQAHPSMSLRMLIKEDISRNGYTDVTCRVPDYGQKKSARSSVSDVVQEKSTRRRVRGSQRVSDGQADTEPVSVQTPSERSVRPVSERAAEIETKVAAEVEAETKAAAEVFVPEQPVADSPKAERKPAVAASVNTQANPSIMSLFAGGSNNAGKPAFSAASMGILDGDE